MLVNVGDKKYSVRWSHPAVEGKNGKTVMRISSCVISELGEERGEAKVVAAGATQCGRKDAFCREIGRRISLTRAIEGMEREVRRVFWEAYWGR